MKSLKNILATALVVAAQALPVQAQDAANAEKPGDANLVAKEVIRQWVATERLLGQESAEWKLEKARVNELLELYTKELSLLNEELEKSGAVATTVDEEKTELENKIADSKAKRVELKTFLNRLNPRVISLVSKLPAPLQDQLKADTEMLKEANDETSVRDLLQATVNVIEAGSSFNRGIYQDKQTIEVGGEQINVDVIYLGLGRAFFNVGKKAGVGIPTQNGWKWERKDELLEQVVRAVDVFKKSTQPQLVELPLKVETVK